MIFFKLRFLLLAYLYFVSTSCFSNEIKVAVLKFGSVNWEIDVIKYHNLDKKYGIKIKRIEMTNKDATAIAFLSKSVDTFVSDWIWVNKQRNQGKLFTFSPFSTASGSLLVKGDSEIKSLRDLQDKRIGVAGGALDKSWLFFRAYSIKEIGKDPISFFKPSYAAPPLINGLIVNNELDGAFNYWNYAARLESKGYKSILNVDDILPSLGIKGELPLIGYVFRDKFVKQNIESLSNFLKASSAARNILDNSDKEWVRIKKLTGAKTDLMLNKIKNSFRKGIPKSSNESMLTTMQIAFKVLEKIGGKKLVGSSKKLQDGIILKNDKVIND